MAHSGSVVLGYQCDVRPSGVGPFADDSNAKCPAWYTAEDNALTQDWSERLAELGGAGFGNPPYSRSQYHDKQAVTGMTHIINHAMAMRKRVVGTFSH
jgi:phage N-6-adenine-methyltransferase